MPIVRPKHERMCVLRDTYGALCHSVDDGGKDVRIARVPHAKHADSVHSGDSSAELNVVSIEVEHLGAAEDGHILELSLCDGGAVDTDDDELGLSFISIFMTALKPTVCFPDRWRETTFGCCSAWSFPSFPLCLHFFDDLISLRNSRPSISPRHYPWRLPPARSMFLIPHLPQP